MDTLENVSKILAIRLSGIGDVVLLMPALAHLKESFGNAHVTLLTGTQCVSVAELCPYIDDVIPVDRYALSRVSWLQALAKIRELARKVRKSGFDLVVDFHSLRETNLLAWASRARYRAALRRSQRAYLGFCFNLEPTVQDETLHIRQTFGRVAENLPGVNPMRTDWHPVIELRPDLHKRAAQLRPPGAFIALYVGASRAPRCWAASRFAAVAAHAIDILGLSVLVISGSSAEEQLVAHEVIEAAGDRAGIFLADSLSFPEVVAVIEVADLLVSNDTGPMHVGPALGTPTIGIFGGGAPYMYRPTGPLDRYVDGPSMDAIAVEPVIRAVDGVWDEMKLQTPT